MTKFLFELLRCPVTRSPLKLEEISVSTKKFDGGEERITERGILYADEDWFYPVIDGIPRLMIEAFIDFEEFFVFHMTDYKAKREHLEKKYKKLLFYTIEKNSHTKKSFSQEWNMFNYSEDNTWDLNGEELLQRFLIETDESKESLQGKMILDAGCGNGFVNRLIAREGAFIVGMDFSNSIEKAYQHNTFSGAFFIQADIQFPPVEFEKFDIVYASGVLIHTNNTELSFSCIDPCVKPGGKMSVWLYHPRKDSIHRIFNFVRRYTSRLPVKFQYYLYLFTLFPVSFLVKRLKGNKQNKREMMVAILDWFSPKFRWEHSHAEVSTWFHKRKYDSIKITTSEKFGFNITGKKQMPR
jgi:SAM-dependent methyltransferase/uncharacterized protein YbaR (Trm112 family)